MMLITLLTDFGIVDPYVAQMKAVILSICPGTTIVDISHGVEKHNVAMGAYMLKTTVPWFPPGTLHVGVIDPGVGSSRSPVVVDCEQGVLIGPDNGLLVGAADALRFRSAYKITNPEFVARDTSSTFHGRDVFARTAAVLAGGRQPKEVGIRIDKLIRLDPPTIDVSKEHISCQVVYVDSFGNLVTDVTTNDMKGVKQHRGKTAQLVTRKREVDCYFVQTYSDIPRGKVGVLFGSQGHLEVAQREANAAVNLEVRVSDRIQIEFR